MKIKNKGRRVVDEAPYGVYLWRRDNGQFISDDDGHQLMIESMNGDPVRLEALKNSVKDFGIEDGGPVFFPGHRIVNDEEYEEQKQRMLFGLIPDTKDVLAIQEGNINASSGR